MVDFNNDTTITTPVHEIVKMLILEKRDNFIEACESFLKTTFSDIAADPGILKARLYTLFLENQAALKRHLKEKQYSELLKNLRSNDFNILIKGFFTINEWLDYMHLTKIDTKQRYDSTKVEEENRIKIR